ncbi:MAG: gamma-glutamyl-gamma-aminobutyrate hydrolase family protein [Acidobacteriota bacterium]|nr:gamma-glutamyl-gamma-aminobutyrate hydrolase family protein [Acidobacteriota bacterium]
MTKRVGVTYGAGDTIGPYTRALESVGLEVVPISPDVPASLAGLDGLLLTGGCDVNPQLYGEEPHPETDEPDDARDELEAALLKQALESDLPVLAICRGMQLFNVVHGGTLVQHLDRCDRHRVKNCDPVHDVSTEPGSKLATALGGEPGVAPVHVNSRHHQGIGAVGKGLVVTARDVEDGMIEGLERPGKRFAVAVQWHPEDQSHGDPVQKRLFEKFAEAM